MRKLSCVTSAVAALCLAYAPATAQAEPDEPAPIVQPNERLTPLASRDDDARDEDAPSDQDAPRDEDDEGDPFRKRLSSVAPIPSPAARWTMTKSSRLAEAPSRSRNSAAA